MSGAVKKNVPALRFPEFEGEWEQRNLGDDIELVSGQHLSPDEFSLEPNNLPYFTGPSDFTNAEGDLTKWALVNAKTAQKDDVLITVKGNGVGVLWLLALKEVALGRQLMAIRATNSSSHFVFQLLGKHLQKFQALASGNMIPGLSRSDITALKPSLPSLPEQKKIAGFLGAVDAKLAGLRRKEAALTRYKRGLMQQLFSGTRRFTQNDGTPYPDWEEKLLGDFCILDSGYPVPGVEIVETKTNTPLLRGVNITEGRIRHSAEIDRFHQGDVRGLSKYLISAGDIVIGMDGSKVGKNVAIVAEADEGAFLIQRVARLKAAKDNDLRYVYHHVTSTNFRRYVDKVNTSSGIPHISLKQIRDFPVLYPHPEEQQKIADALSALDAKISAVTDQITRTDAFKKGLLQQMFV